jgi:hypothetical protein
MRLEGSDPLLAVHDLDRSATWFCRVLGCGSDPDPGHWVQREMALCSPDRHRFMLGQPLRANS